jgi:fluoride exporter
VARDGRSAANGSRTRRKALIGLWVALGGALGAVARFGISGWVTTWAYAGFPWGTFVVNALGSVALGFLNRGFPPPLGLPAARAFFAVGLCGGFTTFSTFDFETLSLLQQGDYTTALFYSLASTATCIAGVAAGLAFAETLSNATTFRR